MGISICRLRYASILQTISSYISNLKWADPSAAIYVPPNTAPDIPPEPEIIKRHLVPTLSDFRSALKVLSYLQLPSETDLDASPPRASIRLTTPVSAVIDTIQACASPFSSPSELSQIGRCYMCQYSNLTPHPLCNSLCRVCGDFNLTSCQLSYPNRLRLTDRTAVVTGARVNLGFFSALRLLRCGAHVLATSRYPHDAEERYLR